MQNNAGSSTSSGSSNYDSRNNEGDTILTRFLHSNRSDHLIIGFIRRGCNVNMSGRNGCLPLHLSMSRPCLMVAYALLYHGAHMDALDGDGATALHSAIEYNNMDGFYMLLLHGADVTITTSSNYTPLMLAINSKNEEITEALLWYYDDFSCVNVWGETALDLALYHESPLALYLIQAGAEFRRCSGDNAALRAASYDDPRLFKVIWSQLDLSILLDTNEPFLISYLEACNFPVAEWIESLFMILSSSVAVDLIQDARNYVSRIDVEQPDFTVISTLFLYCVYNGSKVDDRLALIYLCLSLGDVITVSDVHRALQIFGFKEEVEALIYAGGFVQTRIILQDLFPLPACILAFDGATDQEFTFKLLQNLVKTANTYDAITVLNFFAMSAPKKRQLEELSRDHFPNSHALFRKMLRQSPSVPSLAELSRNQAYKLIRIARGVDKAYQFHDVVKRLDVPALVKDMLRFKAPVYKPSLDCMFCEH